MARVTVEDCLEKVGNRFALVILAAERARMLSKRSQPLVVCDNKPAVTALSCANLVPSRINTHNTPAPISTTSGEAPHTAKPRPAIRSSRPFVPNSRLPARSTPPLPA